MNRTALVAAVCGLVALTLPWSQPSQALDAAEKEIERYRAMISDPMSNPGFLAVDRGEALWQEKRGTKNVSLEGCDLGQGPGKLEGAYAKLPRYFKDADRVMDLEQRLLWCMQNLQGLDTKDVVARRFSGPGKRSDMEDLVAYIANKSSGMKIDVQLTHPKEKEAAAVGEEMFYRRGGVNDFSCATCHGEEGKRIRLQGLPDLSKPGQAPRETMGSWPTYRVSQGALRTMQWRMYDCFRQQRFPELKYVSQTSIDLITYLGVKAKGAKMDSPAIKR